MPQPSATISRLHRVIRTGSSSPALAETADEKLFVVKFSGAGGGARGLLTEYLATGLAAALGLAVPPAKPLWLAKKFPWQIGTDEFDDLVQRSFGWNLGLAFIPDAEPLGAAELDTLLPDFLACLAAVDRILQNVDRTRTNPNILRSAAGIFAIDFGSCLFVNRLAAGAGPYPHALPPNHFLAGTRHAAASPAAVDAAIAALPALITTCPESWLATLPFDAAEFEQRLAAYLRSFTNGGAPPAASS